MSVCPCLHSPNKKTDPFAPNAIAPTGPSALPNAPAQSPTYTPAPTTVEATVAPTPAPPPAEPAMQPASPPVQQVETTPIAKTPVQPSSPSFWDKLESLFTSEEKPAPTSPKGELPLGPIEEEPAKEEPQEPAPITVEQPAPQYVVEKVEEVAPPAPVEEPKVVVQPEIESAPPAVAPKKANIKPQFKPAQKPVVQKKPAPKIVKEVAPIAQTEPIEKDPFATNANAPELPTSLAKPTQPQQTVQTPPAPALAPEPVPEIVPEETKTVETIIEQAPVQPVETPVIVQQPTAPAAQAAPAQELTETTPVEEESNPSFFDRLSNLFSSKPTPQPIEDIEYIDGVPPIELSSPEDMPKTVAPPVAQVQNEVPVKMIKPEPQPISNVAPIKSVTNHPAPSTQQTLQIQEMTQSSAPKAKPFDTTSVAPTTPVAAPQPPTPVVRNISKPKKVTAPMMEKVQTTPSPVAPPIKQPYIPKSSVHANFEEKDDSWFGKIGSFFKDTFGGDDEDKTLVHETEEPKPESPAHVTTKAKKQDEIPAEAEVKPIDPRLMDAKLGLGRNIHLGQGDDDLSTKAKCLTKNRGTVAFCLTPTTWPVRISKYFEVSSHLYRGPQGIVQYDGNIAHPSLCPF